MSVNAHTTPEDLKIEVRALKFREASQAPRWWHGGDPVATAFFNALSALFPQGERFFIDSVKRFRNCGSPKLQDQIAAFITQESLHTREHLAFNRIATDHGYDLTPIDNFLKRRLAWARSRGEHQQLAATMALEHFTAILAHALLGDPAYIDQAPEPIQRLWRWHAIEEIEHKAVAFDTFMAATKNMSNLRRWFMRSAVMVFSTVLFVHTVFFGAKVLFRQDGINTPGTWLRFLHYLFVKPGMFRRVLGAYFTFYKPGFHPWQVDDRRLIAEFIPSIAA